MKEIQGMRYRYQGFIFMKL